jgi:hypothetical protein
MGYNSGIDCQQVTERGETKPAKTWQINRPTLSFVIMT